MTTRRQRDEGGVVTARAPVRVDPAGGGTDAPPFCVEHGGMVVNMGLRLYAFARLEPVPESAEVLIRSEDFGVKDRAACLDELSLGGDLRLLAHIARRLAPPWGFRLSVASEAPPGSGLGSSGAVGVACVAAFSAAMGMKPSPADVADLANDIERSDMGAAGGSQDSFGAALGGVNALQYHRGGGMTPRRVQIASAGKLELERRSLLVYTGEAHLSGSIHEDIKRSYALPDSPTVAAMQGLADVAARSAVALERGDLDMYGKLLSENWRYHQQLHPSCTSERLARFYDALEPHIIGGKTCGAGGGGCILLWLREGERHRAERVSRELGGELFPFRIDGDGLTVW